MKEPSVPDFFPIFVWSLLGPHLVFHVSGRTPVSSLVSDVTARTGVPGHLLSFVVEGKVVAEERVWAGTSPSVGRRGCGEGLLPPNRGGWRSEALDSGSARHVNMVGATRFGRGATRARFRGKRVNKPWVAPLQALGLFRQDWCKTDGNLGMFRHGRRITQPDDQLGQTFKLLPLFSFRG